MNADCAFTSISMTPKMPGGRASKDDFQISGTNHGMEEENINVEGISADDAGDSKAQDTPMADARHFQLGSKLSGEMRSRNNPGIVQEDDDGFDVGLADNTHMDGNAPYHLDDNAIDPTFPDSMGLTTRQCLRRTQ